MPTVPSFHVTREQRRIGWDRTAPPVLAVPSGAELTIDVIDSSGGQLTDTSTLEDVANIDFARVDPFHGPVYVEGAHPGDVLQIDLLEFVPKGYGWTANMPGFGLLADEFPDPWFHVWELGETRAKFVKGISVPIEPFCGVIGVARNEPGNLDVIPPRRTGGNLDSKQLQAGTTLYLPVEVEGALFGLGDTHAAQGDGEVCGNAIEAPMDVTLRLTVRRDFTIETPEYEFVRPLERPSAAAAGYYATTGIGPDLFEATRDAIRHMIDKLGRSHGLDRYEAYALCSTAVDLKISEVVDQPNWVVGAFLPRDLFA
ncbi:MAG TPA: acetamidase/formamidase family protein [Propionibacteriaceae bacterium]|jgi:acetamidase/formamidase